MGIYCWGCIVAGGFFFFAFSSVYPPQPPLKCCPRDAGCGFVCKATDLPSLTHYGLTLKAVLFCLRGWGVVGGGGGGGERRWGWGSLLESGDEEFSNMI